MFKKIKKSNKKNNLISVLMRESPWNMSVEERTQMTISCRDTDYISKVEGAGKITNLKGNKVQLMHNGLSLVYGGYHGDWMAEIIKDLKGHHEPQEEKAFFEVMSILKNTKQNSFTMIELGSFWSYYSLWFMKELKNAKAYCFEPDPNNMAIGKTNAQINGLTPIFVSAAAGSDDGQVVSLPLDSNPSESIDVAIRSVDSIVEEYKIKKIDILHMDVQGVELDALEGAIRSIVQNKVRFLFVSTHHYSFSGDVATHTKCIEFIKKNGGRIVSSHNVLESYSGDGLIVASFSPVDKDLSIHTSVNTSDKSLFRSYEKDLEILTKYLEHEI